MVEVNYYGVEFVNMEKEIVGLWELELGVGICMGDFRNF